MCVRIYHPQMKFAKVMFSQVSVCPQGGMHGGGHAWQGAYVVGACMAGGRACMAGVCMAGGMCGRWGHACLGVCMAGDMVTAAASTHPTGMHSCIDVKSHWSLNMTILLFCQV